MILKSLLTILFPLFQKWLEKTCRMHKRKPNAMTENEIENIVITLGGEDSDTDSENGSECSTHLLDWCKMSGVEGL